MKLFSKYRKFHSHRPQDSLVHRISNDPNLDWLILVVMSIIAAGLFIGIGLMTYNDTRARLSASADSNTSNNKVLFDVEVLSKTIKSFALRAEEYERLMKGYSGVADPSL